MKSKMKKLVSLVLAMAMVFTMSVAVYADDEPTYSITINNAIDGETYSAYKIFDVTTSTVGTSTSYAYTISTSSDWYSLIVNATDIFEVTDSSTDSTKYVSVKSGVLDDTVTNFFKTNASTALSSATADATATAASGTAVISLGSSGYYYVTTSAGSVITLDTAAPTASVDEKNTKPTVDKTVSDTGEDDYDKANTAGIGDTVYFKAVISNINDASNIKFHDTMSAGLTFDGAESVKVYLNDTTGTLLSQGVSNDYQVTSPGSETNESDKCTFEIDFTSYLASATGLTDESTLVVYYTATVNADAVIGSNGNPNTAKVTFGEASTTEESTTTTYVYELNVFKYTEVGAEEKALENASFVLYKVDSSTTTYYATVKDGKLTGWVDSQDKATTLVSDSDGIIAIDGLDLGTYYLLETAAPDGYNKLTSAVVVTVGTADNSNVEKVTYGTSEGATVNNYSNVVKVKNQSGTELPSTGGIGTTIFYIVGAILVLGAGVILVTRRRTASR